MDALKICIRGSFSSLRETRGMRYQKTYSMPTKTTIIGLAGAALGFRGKALEPLFEAFKVSVVQEGRSGFAQDLWSITKPKKDTKTERAVYIRELLYAPTYSIYFSSTREEELKKLYVAFSDPVYPLVLGKNDELAIIEKNQLVKLKKAEEMALYKHTIVPFDYRTKKYEFEKIDLLKGTTIRPPYVVRLPSAFSIADDGIFRTPMNYIKVSFIENLGIRFKDEPGLTDGTNNFFFW